jgi:hypothetical protein
MNLPIYDILYNESSDNDLTQTEKDNFIKLIKKIDNEGSEIIYAIIKIYCINNFTGENQNYLYGAKFLKCSIKFDLDDFPHRLKQMLNKFLNKHIKKMDEDNQRVI